MTIAEPPVRKLIHEATVTAQTDYGHGYYVVELACPELAAAIDVGQFVNVRVRGELAPLLRRPFSVFEVFRDAKGEATGLSLLYHVVGAGTRLMSKWQPGVKVSITGPLGQTFPKPAGKNTPVIMVGGGIGLAPFLLQAEKWMSQDKERPMVLIAGGRSSRDLKYMSVFGRLGKQGLNLMICTEDGSMGVRGRVTLPLEGELSALSKRGERAQVYACGPTPMMAAVSEMCKGFEMPCIVSLESVMACGYGVCNGCVSPVKDATSERGFKYVKTCTYGPAFDGSMLVWDAMLKA